MPIFVPRHPLPGQRENLAARPSCELEEIDDFLNVDLEPFDVREILSNVTSNAQATRRRQDYGP